MRVLSTSTIKVFIFLSLFGGFTGPAIASVSFPIPLKPALTDIWRYNTLSLNNFKDLVWNIWTRKEIGLAGVPTADIVSVSDMEETKKTVAANKKILEQIINEPVVKNLTEDPPAVNPLEKLAQTKTAADNIFSSIQNIKSRCLMLTEKWPDLTDSEIKTELTNLSSIFTQDLNQKDSNILAYTNWLKTSWDTPLMTTLSNKAISAQGKFDNLLSDVISFGKVNDAQVLAPALAEINELDSLVGTSLAKPEDQSLFGFIRKTSDRITLFNDQSAEGIRILSELKTDPSKDQTADIDLLRTKILGANDVPDAALFFSAAGGPQAATNEVLNLLALIETNKLLMGGTPGAVTKNIWLENGSVVFRIVVTNRSRSKTQKVPVSYLLPAEVHQEQIISHDPALTVAPGSNGNTLIASGEILLEPLETRTLGITVEDLWKFNPVEIENLKSQTVELTLALKNTLDAIKAVSINKEIDISLNKILDRELQAIAPETKILAYRTSLKELNGIEEKISSLQSMVVASHGNGGVVVRGLILLIFATMIFVAIYYSAHLQDLKRRRATVTSPEKEYVRKISYRHRENTHPWGRRIIKMMIITLLSGGFGSVGVSLVLKAGPATQLTDTFESPTGTQVLGSSIDITPKKFPYEAKVLPPKSADIPVRSGPSFTSPQISSIKEPGTISVFKKVDHWVKIVGQGDKDQGWWINEAFLQ